MVVTKEKIGSIYLWMSIRLTPSSSCIYILLLTPPTFSFKPLMHTSCLCILYIVYMVQVQTQDRQTQDRSNPRQVKHKTRKPKTGQTQDRSNPRQGQTQDRVKPKTGVKPKTTFILSTRVRWGPGGGAKFCFQSSPASRFRDKTFRLYFETPDNFTKVSYLINHHILIIYVYIYVYHIIS